MRTLTTMQLTRIVYELAKFERDMSAGDEFGARLFAEDLALYLCDLFSAELNLFRTGRDLCIKSVK